MVAVKRAAYETIHNDTTNSKVVANTVRSGALDTTNLELRTKKKKSGKSAKSATSARANAVRDKMAKDPAVQGGSPVKATKKTKTKKSKKSKTDKDSAPHTALAAVAEQTKHTTNIKEKAPKPALANAVPFSQIQAYHYKMEGHCQQCVDKYLELSGKDISSLKPVPTPSLDDKSFTDADMVTKGALQANASKCVLKCLWVARQSRPDLLWSINTLARNITKWTTACDKRLHRLISYMYHTRE